MPKEYNFTPQEIEDGKGLAGVAYLTWVGLLIAALVGKDNRFTMYHVQQSLALMIGWLALSVIAVIPILGWIVMVVGWIICLVLLIIGLLNGFRGDAKPLPIIGELGFKFNLVKGGTTGGNTTGSETPPTPPTE